MLCAECEAMHYRDGGGVCHACPEGATVEMALACLGFLAVVTLMMRVGLKALAQTKMNMKGSKLPSA